MARYRRIRNDFYVHQRTAGLSPVARCILLLAVLENAHGVICRSNKGLASTVGASNKEVNSAIRELVDRQIATWWEEYEILFVHEAADEQCMNSSMWDSIASDLRRFPMPILVAFSKRYPDVITVPDTVVDTVGVHSGGESVGHSPVSVTDPVSVNSQIGADAADPIAKCAERIKRAVVDYRRMCGIDARLTKVTRQDISLVKAATKAGYSEDEILLAAWRQYKQDCRDKASAQKWLTMSTVLRPRNIARLLEWDQLGEPPESGSANGPELVQIAGDWWHLHPDGRKTPADPPDDDPTD